MAKATAASATDQSPAPGMLLKFRDKVFTSRTLCIADTNRTLAVVATMVEVSAADEQAVSYLKAHPDFEPVE